MKIGCPGLAGCWRIAIRRACGMTSLSSSSRFTVSSVDRMESPVVLPPGLARPAINPMLNGSDTAPMTIRGLTANQIACALISMMARSTTRSTQRPDTLMQDRSYRIDENLLQRAAGPYMRVRGRNTCRQQNTSALASKGDLNAACQYRRDGLMCDIRGLA